MKKIKYAVPFIFICLFPLYFQLVSQSYSWLTDDKGSQAFLGFATIILVGFAGSFFFLETLE